MLLQTEQEWQLSDVSLNFFALRTPLENAHLDKSIMFQYSAAKSSKIPHFSYFCSNLHSLILDECKCVLHLQRKCFTRIDDKE